MLLSVHVLKSKHVNFFYLIHRDGMAKKEIVGMEEEKEKRV